MRAPPRTPAAAHNDHAGSCATNLPTPQRPTTERGRGRAGPRRADDDRVLTEPTTIEATPKLPRVPASACGLTFDKAGRLLVLNPPNEQGWTVPGGQVNADGESPWDACRRATREQCGLGRRQDDASASPLERYGYRDLGWIAQKYAPFWLAELILLWRNRRVFFTALQRIMSENDYAVYPPTTSSDHFRGETRFDEIEWFPTRSREEIDGRKSWT